MLRKLISFACFIRVAMALGGFPIVILEQPTEPFTTVNVALFSLFLASRRHQKDVALTLVRTFSMITARIDFSVAFVCQRLYRYLCTQEYAN